MSLLSLLCTGGDMKSGAARDRLAQGIVGAAGGLGAYVIIVLTALPVIRAVSSPPPPLPCFAQQGFYGQVTNPTGCGGTPNGKYTYSTTANPAQNKVSPPTQCQWQQTCCSSSCSYIRNQLQHSSPGRSAIVYAWGPMQPLEGFLLWCNCWLC